jgi:hypothetical protein
MRTRDENDLNRVKEEYGPEILKSIVKAAVGTGMVENAEYNRGKPFFVSFRPVLHSTRRVTEKDLESYNKYNAILNDFEYQLEQLKKENLDIFDLTLELKLAKDKLKTSNFNMVDIYLDSLKPRIEKEWKKIGKEPKHYKPKFAVEEEAPAKKNEEKRKETESSMTSAKAKKKEGKKAKPAATGNIATKGQKEEKAEAATASPKKPSEKIDLINEAKTLISKMNASLQDGNADGSKQLYAQLCQLYKKMDKEQKAQIYPEIIAMQKELSK